jgi:hypothetical protein
LTGLTPARRRTAAERGEALLFAVFALLLLSLSLALLTLTMRLRIEERQRDLGSVHLDLLLDGAMAETLGRLAVDPSFAGLEPRRDGAGEAWTEVERIGTFARVEVGARLGSGRGHARARVQLFPGPPRLVRWERGAASP